MFEQLCGIIYVSFIFFFIIILFLTIIYLIYYYTVIFNDQINNIIRLNNTFLFINLKSILLFCLVHLMKILSVYIINR